MTFKEYIRKNNISKDITILDCSYKELTDLNGIEEFTNLTLLNCSNNKLTIIPNLDKLINLKELYCENNENSLNIEKLKTEVKLYILFIDKSFCGVFSDKLKLYEEVSEYVEEMSDGSIKLSDSYELNDEFSAYEININEGYFITLNEYTKPDNVEKLIEVNFGTNISFHRDFKRLKRDFKISKILSN